MFTPLEIAYDESLDLLTINGIRYSGSLFRELAFAPIGTHLRVLERKDGCLTLERLYEQDEIIQTRYGEDRL